MKNSITKLSYLLLFLLISSTSLALEAEIIRDMDKWREKIATLDWKNLEENEFRASVPGSNGSIKIDKEEIFLEGDDINQYSYWTWGTGDASQMLIRHTNQDQIFIQFKDSGYVKMDDWKNVDTQAMMKQLNDDAETWVEHSKEKNIDYATNLSWVMKPQLDNQTNMVYYAYKVEWSNGRATLESKSLVLGRSGYAEITFVTPYKENVSLKTVSNNNKDKASTFEFESEKTYSEYKTGDKIAAVGIGALLATTLGVKALSPGLLATLGKLLAKFWFILLLPFVFIGKLIDSLKTKKKRR